MEANPDWVVIALDIANAINEIQPYRASTSMLLELYMFEHMEFQLEVMPLSW